MRSWLRASLGAMLLVCALGAGAQMTMTPNGIVAPDGTKPLPPVAGTISWGVLQGVKTVPDKDGRVLPQFNAEQKKLNKKDIKVHGFMLPLEAGETQKKFVLSPYPPSCPFCMTAGPDSVIEVVCAKPAKVTFEPVVVSGKMQVMEHDETGFYYRITEASAVEN